jgi:very-short-patch-repair endonuclease
MKKTPYKFKAEATEAEKKLWYILRSRRFMNLKFRRQQMLGKYIVDFYCASKKIVLEIDGGQHAEKKAYDNRRTKELELPGCKVYRFWDNEALNNFDNVKDRLFEILS